MAAQWIWSGSYAVAAFYALIGLDWTWPAAFGTLWLGIDLFMWWLATRPRRHLW